MDGGGALVGLGRVSGAALAWATASAAPAAVVCATRCSRIRRFRDEGIAELSSVGNGPIRNLSGWRVQQWIEARSRSLARWTKQADHHTLCGDGKDKCCWPCHQPGQHPRVHPCGRVPVGKAVRMQLAQRRQQARHQARLSQRKQAVAQASFMHLNGPGFARPASRCQSRRADRPGSTRTRPVPSPGQMAPAAPQARQSGGLPTAPGDCARSN